MSRKKSVRKHREYSAELKEEAVQMLLDGHSAESVVSNLGLSGTSLVYRWKAKFLQASGPAAGKLEARVCQPVGLKWPAPRGAYPKSPAPSRRLAVSSPGRRSLVQSVLVYDATGVSLMDQMLPAP